MQGFFFSFFFLPEGLHHLGTRGGSDAMMNCELQNFHSRMKARYETYFKGSFIRLLGSWISGGCRRCLAGW